MKKTLELVTSFYDKVGKKVFLAPFLSFITIFLISKLNFSIPLFGQYNNLVIFGVFAFLYVYLLILLDNCIFKFKNYKYNKKQEIKNKHLLEEALIIIADMFTSNGRKELVEFVINDNKPREENYLCQEIYTFQFTNPCSGHKSNLFYSIKIQQNMRKYILYKEYYEIYKKYYEQNGYIGKVDV